ncbi:MAG TPA: hypothetical protein VFR14_00820 [Candidatus Limnocylindrales bacterium]|nr:hypothetical protein [Candidatus Limnocylindrales bacterium]
MPGLDDVLERLITDPAFRDRLATDRRAALAGYDLSPDDLALLDAQVSGAVGGTAAMEGRTTKAGMFGLLGGLDEVLGAMGDAGATSEPVVGAADPVAPAVGEHVPRHIDVESFQFGSGAAPTADDPSTIFTGEVVGIEPTYEAAGDSAAGDTVDNDETITIHGNRSEADPIPTESISFNFEQIKVTHDEYEVASGVGDVASADAAGSAPAAAADDSHVTEHVSFVYKAIEMEGPGSPGPVGGGANEIASEDTTGSAEAADSHEGEIDVVSVPVGTTPATGEGRVDAADYVLWRKTDGAAADGPVDAADYVVWRKNLGGAEDGTEALAAGEADPDAASGDVVMKGSTIGENAPAPAEPALEADEPDEASR